MPTYFQLEISLCHIRPRIWRQILLHKHASLQDLHKAIQDSFGWHNAHLFEFRTMGHNGTSLTEPDYNNPTAAPPLHPREISLTDAFAQSADQTLLYVYDFGDYWEHEVYLKDQPVLEETFQRKLLAGARSAPPEDCGGPGGYERFSQIHETGEDPWGDDPEEVKAWLGAWDPDGFILRDAQRTFDAPKTTRRTRSTGAARPSTQNLGEKLPTKLSKDAPEAVRKVPTLLKRHMKKHGWPAHHIKEAQELWCAFYQTDKPRVRKPETYAATVEYCMNLIHRQPFNQSDLARAYKISAPSISQKYQRILEVYQAHAPQAPPKNMGTLEEMIAELEAALGSIPPAILNSIREEGDMQRLQNIIQSFASDLTTSPPTPPPTLNVLPTDAYTWPLIYCMVPDKTIWDATGCGTVLVVRQNPQGLCVARAAIINIAQGGLQTVLETPPAPRDMVEEMVHPSSLQQLMACQDGTEEMAARYFLGAFSLNPEHPDVSVHEMALFLPPSTSSHEETAQDFITHLIPQKLFALALESAADRLQDSTTPISLLTQITLSLQASKVMLSHLQTSPEFTFRKKNADTHHFTWRVPYELRNPQDSDGPQDAHIRLKGDILTLSAMNTTIAASLMHRLRDDYGQGWLLQEASWSDPKAPLTAS